MVVYIAIFDPPDSAAIILGAYTTEALAEAKIQREIAADKEYSPNYPRRYEQRRCYYNIDEHQLDAGVELSVSHMENNNA